MTQNPIISINGEINGTLSVLDRGFAYGDGFFETCRIYNNKIHLWDLHLQRLQKTAKRLSIPLDVIKLQIFIDDLLKKSVELNTENLCLKIQITRGVSLRGYAYDQETSPTYCLFLSSANSLLVQQWLDGVKVRICSLRLSDSKALAGLKHLNRLENILARAEWTDQYAEGFLFNQEGNLIEATMSNVFLVVNGKLLTPDLLCSGVKGVMREFIINKLAPTIGLNVEVKILGIEEILAADELFICNSLIGIWPVVDIDVNQAKTLPLGVITQTLQKGLAKDVFS